MALHIAAADFPDYSYSHGALKVNVSTDNRRIFLSTARDYYMEKAWGVFESFTRRNMVIYGPVHLAAVIAGLKALFFSAAGVICFNVQMLLWNMPGLVEINLNPDDAAAIVNMDRSSAYKCFNKWGYHFQSLLLGYLAGQKLFEMQQLGFYAKISSEAVQDATISLLSVRNPATLARMTNRSCEGYVFGIEETFLIAMRRFAVDPRTLRVPTNVGSEDDERDQLASTSSSSSYTTTDSSDSDVTIRPTKRPKFSGKKMA